MQAHLHVILCCQKSLIWIETDAHIETTCWQINWKYWDLHSLSQFSKPAFHLRAELHSSGNVWAQRCNILNSNYFKVGGKPHQLHHWEREIQETCFLLILVLWNFVKIIVITQHAKTIPINWYYLACPSKQLHLIGTTQDFISFLFTIMPAVPLLNLLLSQGPWQYIWFLEYLEMN